MIYYILPCNSKKKTEIFLLVLSMGFIPWQSVFFSKEEALRKIHEIHRDYEIVDDKYPYGKPQTDEVARGSGNREYGCRRLREKLPNFSGVSFLEPGIPVIE